MTFKGSHIQETNIKRNITHSTNTCGQNVNIFESKGFVNLVVAKFFGFRHLPGSDGCCDDVAFVRLLLLKLFDTFSPVLVVLLYCC